jgi:hypothetical protein
MHVPSVFECIRAQSEKPVEREKEKKTAKEKH